MLFFVISISLGDPHFYDRAIKPNIFGFSAYDILEG